MTNKHIPMIDVAFLIDRTEEIGQVVAVIPALSGSAGRLNHCACYVHTGQRGACDLKAMRNYYDQATEAEYADLFAELDGVYYNLCVISKDRIDGANYEVARRQQIWL